MARTTQWMQVLSALEQLGGIATLSQLNHALLSPGGDGVNWKTNTPEATIRRIVRQKTDQFSSIKPGLYCLRESAAKFEKEYTLPQEDDIPPQVEDRNHWYYQGLMVEIGKAQGYKTYVPPQDKNRTFVNRKLGDVCDIPKLPNFGYRDLMRRARTVDVIWFNRRNMPAKMFEIEISTDMLNSLTKFNELRDFYTALKIVAPSRRKNYFADRIKLDTFYEIRGRVKFLGFEELEKNYASGKYTFSKQE